MSHSNGLGNDRHEFRDTPPVRAEFAALPDVIAIGPPRTATTWMHRILKGHLNLAESVKETRFFDLRYANGMAWYAAHFRNARAGLPTAEIAPTYFYSSDARFRIAERLPDVRIVATFRDPVERLFSLYKLKCASGKITDSFEAAVESDDEMRESARYGYHLAEWISMFGRNRVLILIYEDLLSDPQTFVDQLCDFVGIERFEVDADMQQKENSTDAAVAPRMAWWTKLGVSASEWMRSHRFDRTMAVVRATRVRRLFFGSGPELPTLNPTFVRELHKQLRPQVEAVERAIGHEIPAWRPSAL
ncbi:MAG TPA: sulfotransferase [Candidatus Binataceae bacterium]|nr:sulfotransferase [Candidatus Binataceae bacterium]